MARTRRGADYSIYALIDPRDNLVHYIGRTSDIRWRLNRHMQNKTARESNDKREWIESLKRLSLMPIFKVIITDLTTQEAAIQERHYIQHYLELGMPLKNKRTAYETYKSYKAK